MLYRVTPGRDGIFNSSDDSRQYAWLSVQFPNMLSPLSPNGAKLITGMSRPLNSGGPNVRFDTDPSFARAYSIRANNHHHYASTETIQRSF